MASYTVEFKEEAVRKVLLSDNPRSIAEVAKNIGVSYPALRQWIKRHHEVILLNSELSKTQKINAVLNTLNLSAKEKSSYCRREGFLPEQLEDWELDMKERLTTSSVDESEYKKLKNEKDALKKQLSSRDKE